MSDWALHEGDAVEVMRGMADGSISAIVTDPPYGLEFMGMAWDDFDGRENGTPRPRNEWQDFGSREHARTLEDRPRIQRNKGLAFYEFSLAWATEAERILKPGGNLLAAGGTRTYHRLVCAIEDAGFQIVDTVMHLHGQGFPKGKALLKPAWEPWTLARKKGKGWLGIDECRVGMTPTDAKASGRPGHTEHVTRSDGVTGWGANRMHAEQHPAGRWPSNVILDEVTAAMLDEQSGERRSAGLYPSESRGTGASVTYGQSLPQGALYADSGGASRFYYVAKASASERTLPDGTRSNHPTVKPLTLMRYLCRLACPAGGTILDPFAGSGTTGVAALLEGFDFIGIDSHAPYVEIARQRLLTASGGNLPLFAMVPA